MKKLLTILLVLLVFTNTAYASAKQKRTMDRVMSSWMGESTDNVIKAWGYPDEEKKIAGKTLYFYYKYATSPYGSSKIEYCTRIIEADKNSKVIDAKWQSTPNANAPALGCPSTYLCVKRWNWVNPNNDPWKKEKELKKQQKAKKKAAKSSER